MGTAWSPEAQPAETEDALQVSGEHLDLLPELCRNRPIVALPEALVREAVDDESLARPMTETVARVLQGAELLRYSTEEVVDVFLGPRCPGGSGAWGSHYGTLSAAVMQPVTRKITQRAMVAG